PPAGGLDAHCLDSLRAASRHRSPVRAVVEDLAGELAFLEPGHRTVADERSREGSGLGARGGLPRERREPASADTAGRRDRPEILFITDRRLRPIEELWDRLA